MMLTPAAPVVAHGSYFDTSTIAIASIAAAAIAGIIIRPWRLPEALWAVVGAAALVLCSLLSLDDAWAAVRKGNDVYLFLIGMMLLAEVARQEGLFDWLAAAQRANAPPLPYLFVCAFIANAASFVLPISNPANLVVFRAAMPTLGGWLTQFGLASLVAVIVTYAILRVTQRKSLQGAVAPIISLPSLSLGGRCAAAGIVLTALILLIASSLDRPNAAAQERPAHRRRLRPQSFRHRLARHDSLTGRAASRESNRQRLAVSRARVLSDAAGVAGGADKRRRGWAAMT